jgi:hypothetical protein
MSTPDLSFLTNKPVFHSLGFDYANEQWKFTVVMGGQSFDYSGGLWAFVPQAYQKKKQYSNTYYTVNPREAIKKEIERFPNSRLASIARHISQGGVQIKKNTGDHDVRAYVAMIGKYNRPDPAGFLYCMISDMDCGEYSSFQDFCDNLGYDNDSIKALETYQACQQGARKFRQVVTTAEVEKLREVLQDY